MKILILFTLIAIPLVLSASSGYACMLLHNSQTKKSNTNTVASNTTGRLSIQHTDTRQTQQPAADEHEE